MVSWASGARLRRLLASREVSCEEATLRFCQGGVQQQTRVQDWSLTRSLRRLWLWAGDQEEVLEEGGDHSRLYGSNRPRSRQPVTLPRGRKLVLDADNMALSCFDGHYRLDRVLQALYAHLAMDASEIVVFMGMDHVHKTDTGIHCCYCWPKRTHVHERTRNAYIHTQHIF